jgi:hypothetical protein
MIVVLVEEIRVRLEAVGLQLQPGAYLFSNHPADAQPWNPDWITHRIADLAGAAGVELNIKALRHYTATQLPAGRVQKTKPQRFGLRSAPPADRERRAEAFSKDIAPEVGAPRPSASQR